MGIAGRNGLLRLRHISAIRCKILEDNLILNLVLHDIDDDVRIVCVVFN